MAPTKPHVLVVDDDQEIRDLVSKLIAAEGYRVTRAHDARCARHVLDADDVDLMVLDLMLPKMDGLTFCREVRASDMNLPIIMLTAKGDDFDRVLGLEMGADDYLPKPFHSRELLARIKAVLRRSTVQHEQVGPTRAPPYLVRGLAARHRQARTGFRRQCLVLLSSAEFELLTAFLTWPQVILSREKLLDATRGRSAVISDRSIDIQSAGCAARSGTTRGRRG